ncbi:hypothetical protein GMRT_13574 [Giardia muris]|uniref:Transmembrane protein n=1 Tax=Giardia muris TaxID=5742 RepID=A0A4Z1SW44_GIAMU|nr:hypothetical protein GMRT_13574 [Giardia muris]|eukprot:TNJ29994.1 hypothetical protein GMRT_13574 [Giardia muris]
MSERETEDLCPCISDGAGPCTIVTVYILIVIVIAVGGWVTYQFPRLGWPFVVMGIGFLISWFFFERQYRSVNPALEKGRKEAST